jgi:peptidoglycan/xylan/chitin deacetylase (PgdA/CDA1 family)
VLSFRALEGVTRRATAGTVSILVLHRVKGPGDDDYEADPIERIADGLDLLVRRGYQFTSLEELIDGSVAPKPGLLCLTADDGYEDQARVLAHLTGSLRIPLTIFLTTGFLDYQQANWWDQVYFCLAHCRRSAVSVPIPGVPERLELSGPSALVESAQTLRWALKRLPEEERQAGMVTLADVTGVALPKAPFGSYRPLSWEEARRLEAGGLVTFGPHSVSHPILSRVNREQARSEIHQSWSRLKAELDRPLPVFCYPNGEDGDFGPREESLVQEAGLRAALAIDGRPTRLADFHHPARRYRLSRLSFSPDPFRLATPVAGSAHLKWLLRDWRRAEPA